MSFALLNQGVRLSMFGSTRKTLGSQSTDFPVSEDYTLAQALHTANVQTQYVGTASTAYSNTTGSVDTLDLRAFPTAFGSLLFTGINAAIIYNRSATEALKLVTTTNGFIGHYTGSVANFDYTVQPLGFAVLYVGVTPITVGASSQRYLKIRTAANTAAYELGLVGVV